jgi:BlaI family transcriptional regulator, penicillinase repressor
MGGQDARTPTPAELRILRILWHRGPSTVHEVHTALATERPVGYTTALKMLQVMTEKGLVEREVVGRAHRYRPVAAEATTQRQLLRDLVDRAFGGSVDALVLRALSDSDVPRADLEEIERLLRREHERRP